MIGEITGGWLLLSTRSNYPVIRLCPQSPAAGHAELILGQIRSVCCFICTNDKLHLWTNADVVSYRRWTKLWSHVHWL